MRASTQSGEGETGKTFLYPDPPLGREELQVLQQLRPNARFLTPLTKLARWPRPSPIESFTTPTEESVRRALAIQTIIRQELGQSANENPLQGSFYIEALTDRVEEAVYAACTRCATAASARSPRPSTRSAGAIGGGSERAAGVRPDSRIA